MSNFKAIKVALLFVVMACCAFSVNAEKKKELKYVNALEFRMINKGFDNTESPYHRLPAYLKDSIMKDKSRAGLWDRARNCAGMAIRFASNSERIGIRYNLTWNFHMAHMADTGIKGTDLYIMNDDGKWEYVNTNRPYKKDSIQTKIYADGLPKEMREYMIYLPLYDGVNWMEIGVDSTAVIQQPILNNPRKEKKVVFYGTSILQGGCATRTGMVATNMIQRDLNAECVNLGFSGEGKMDNYMALAMAEIEGVTAFVLDPIPNCTKDMCEKLTYGFVNTLRKHCPGVPIIMVEGPMYSYTKYDKFTKNYLAQKNEAWRKNYEKLKAENPNNLYYVTCEGLSGYDNEGTVDGIHFTDLGFRAYADKLNEILKFIVE